MVHHLKNQLKIVTSATEQWLHMTILNSFLAWPYNQLTKDSVIFDKPLIHSCYIVSKLKQHNSSVFQSKLLPNEFIHFIPTVVLKIASRFNLVIAIFQNFQGEYAHQKPEAEEFYACWVYNTVYALVSLFTLYTHTYHIAKPLHCYNSYY